MKKLRIGKNSLNEAADSAFGMYTVYAHAISTRLGVSLKTAAQVEDVMRTMVIDSGYSGTLDAVSREDFDSAARAALNLLPILRAEGLAR